MTGADAWQDSPEEREVSSWLPIDLGPVLDGTYTPPHPLLFPRSDGICLLYPGLTHSFHGESESGKSMLLQLETARLLRAGQRVLFIDYESDAASVVERLRLFGASDDALRSEHFDYVKPERDNRSSIGAAAWLVLCRRAYSLIVIDGVTEALGSWGRTTKDNDEVADWMRSVPKMLARQTGAAVVMVDHVTKDKDTRGRFALGAQAKMAGLTGAAYTVEIDQPLGRGLRGVIVLRVGKDRPGYVRARCGHMRHSDRTQEAARIVIDSTGDGAPHVSVEPPRTGDDAGGATFRPTAIMEKISRLLEGASDPMSQSEIERTIGGKAAHARTALQLLEREGYVKVGPGPRGSRMHAALKSYRQEQDGQSAAS